MSEQELCAKCNQPLTEGNRVKIYSPGADGVVIVQLRHKTCAKPVISLRLEDTPNKAAVSKFRLYWKSGAPKGTILELFSVNSCQRCHRSRHQLIWQRSCSSGSVSENRASER
jgi:hypothetical protein